MTTTLHKISNRHGGRPVILNLSNYVTWSFPEFVPFCADLYYFSNLKRFSHSSEAI